MQEGRCAGHREEQPQEALVPRQRDDDDRDLVVPEDFEEEYLGPLNERQRLFVLNYLANGFNATQAYKDAGYQARGHAAESAASRLLRNVEVSAAISEALRRHLSPRYHEGREVVQELYHVALGDLSDVLEWGPGYVRIRPSEDLPKRVTAAVKSIKIRHTDQGTHQEIQMHNKVAALRQLAEVEELVQPAQDREVLVVFMDPMPETSMEELENDPDVIIPSKLEPEQIQEADWEEVVAP